MKIRVTGRVFVAPLGSLVRLNHEAPEGKKSQFDRRRPWVEKHGSWLRCKRALQFKQGEELEIQGPIKDRLLQQTFEIIEATEAETPPPKKKTDVTDSAKPAKKKATKKKAAKKA